MDGTNDSVTFDPINTSGSVVRSTQQLGSALCAWQQIPLVRDDTGAARAGDTCKAVVPSPCASINDPTPCVSMTGWLEVGPAAALVEIKIVGSFVCTPALAILNSGRAAR